MTLAKQCLKSPHLTSRGPDLDTHSNSWFWLLTNASPRRQWLWPRQLVRAFTGKTQTELMHHGFSPSIVLAEWYKKSWVVYVCTHFPILFLHLYILIYVCVYMHTCLNMFKCLYSIYQYNIYTYIHVCKYVYVYMCVHKYIFLSRGKISKNASGFKSYH